MTTKADKEIAILSMSSNLGLALLATGVALYTIAAAFTASGNTAAIPASQNILSAGEALSAIGLIIFAVSFLWLMFCVRSEN